MMLGNCFNPAPGCSCVADPNVQCLGQAVSSDNLESYFESLQLKAVGGDPLLKTNGSLPAGPKEREVPTYATTDDEVMRGEPLYAGSILQLMLGESIQETHLALYINGFSLTPVAPIDSYAGGSESVCRAWSPFSLVEQCQVKTMRQSTFWAVFKLTVFRKEGQDRCYYFATAGTNAYKERDQWVNEMVNAIVNVTVSLFPPHAITVQPVPGVAATSARIMAGYLLLSDGGDTISLVYCELNAYSGGEGRLTVYRDEWCELQVSSILLSDSTVISSRKGSYCTIFGVDLHRFCARTREEKDLWLRAVSNVKVKLMFDAPDPTVEDLTNFRAAVHERIEKLQGETPRKEIAIDPLLNLVPRAPLETPRGDACDPDPIDEDFYTPVLKNISSECSSLHEDTGEGDCVDPRSLHQITRFKGLQPEACRELLRAVPAEADQEADAGRRRPGVEMPPEAEKYVDFQSLPAASLAPAELLPDKGEGLGATPNECPIEGACGRREELCQPACLPSRGALR